MKKQPRNHYDFPIAFLFTFKTDIPTTTSKSPMILNNKFPFSSPSRRYDKTKPKIGVNELNTVTDETSLYLSNILQSEYATADTQARYKRINMPHALNEILPPIKKPTTLITAPPRIN